MAAGRRERIGVLARTMAVLALVVAVPRAATSAEKQPGRAKRVLLILDHPADPFAERIRANIEGLGLRPVIVEGWRDTESAEHMEAATREQHASAAIRMLPSGRGVEIWMGDETSGRSLLRHLIVDNSLGGPNENMVAMQLVELLRTSLLVEPDQPPEEPPPAPEPLPIQQAAPAEPATCGSSPLSCPHVQAGVGALAGFGGSGVALQGWFSLQTALGRAAGLALDVAVPIVPSSVSGPEGSASIATYFLGLAALTRLDHRESRLSATAGAGAALLRLAGDGTPNQPLTTRSPDLLTGAGYFRADAACDLTHWLRVALRVTTGVALHRVDIIFAGNNAASWGRFFAAGTLMLDVGRR